MGSEYVYCKHCYVLVGTQHDPSCPATSREAGENHGKKDESAGRQAGGEEADPPRFTNGYEIRHREAARDVAATAPGPDAEEAERRRLLGQSRRIRVLLYDGAHYDVVITIPWLEWMTQALRFAGIMFDHGWIPLRSIKLIAPLAADGQEIKFEGNVVPLKRPT